MRILHIAHAYPPTVGGVETHLWDITHGLTRRGRQVACLVGGDPETLCVHAPDGGKIAVRRTPALSVGSLVDRRRGRPPDFIDPKLLLEQEAILTQTLDDFAPDIVHMHNAHHFAPELAMATLARAAPIPVLNSVHDRVGEHLYPAVLGLDWSRVIYASRYLAETLPTPRPATTLHLGIDLGLFCAEGEGDERLLALERPVIFHPARLLRWKGVLVGVEAFGQLRRALGRGSLVLCESTRTVENQMEMAAFEVEVRSLAAREGVASHLHLLPFGRAQMPAAYRASDLVWYPTIDEEPLGLAPPEAMACGAPLVVSRSGGMLETVSDGQTGLIVPRHDAAALAEAAHRLLSQEGAALRGALVDRARREAVRFSGEKYLDVLEQLYDAELRAHRRARA